MRKILDSPKVNEDATEPWEPASLLKADPIPGFRTRWIRKDILDKKMAEGWIPVEANESIAPEKTIIDGSQQGSYVTKRNLIFCKMPEAKAKARDAYFKNLTDGASQATTEKFKSKFGSKESYGEGLKEDQID